MIEDVERCLQAIASRDERFDGWFFVGVTSTGVYSRPSCPAAALPRREHVRLFATAAAAQAAGFRACKRCRPDASPGSPVWSVRSDLVARAMRLILDGLVDREGAAGLAGRLGVSRSHLDRLMYDNTGAGLLALSRAHRAGTARALIEHTELSFAEVAAAAGFPSVRQLDETVRSVLASTPRALRSRARNGGHEAPGQVSLRLPVRQPFRADELLRFLGERAVAGVEEWCDGRYRRVLSLPRGLGTADLAPGDGDVGCTLRLQSLADLGAAVARCRRLLDLDADPVAVDETLGADPALGALVRRRPGLRSPGTVDGSELAVRAVLGQQISVAAARTQAAVLAGAVGSPLPQPDGGLLRGFPGPEAVAEAPDAALPMPAARRTAVRELAALLARRTVVLDAGADREEAVRRLLAVKGVGPWTAAYVAMRALGDPDVLLATDLGVKRALARLRIDTAVLDAARWRPWRTYATHHLWASLSDPVAEP